MIITDISEQVKSGKILIEPYNPARTSINSHDLTLYRVLAVYKDEVLDAAKPNDIVYFRIPEEGYVLQPGIIYLGATNERAGSRFYVPKITGKSSTGRLGIQIHCTAGFGDVGFEQWWTLEISVTQPVRIYSNMPICQVYFTAVNKIPEIQYNGNYSQQGPMPTSSKMYKNFPLD